VAHHGTPGSKAKVEPEASLCNAEKKTGLNTGGEKKVDDKGGRCPRELKKKTTWSLRGRGTKLGKSKVKAGC